jgi:hypothetical protein
VAPGVFAAAIAIRSRENDPSPFSSSSSSLPPLPPPPHRKRRRGTTSALLATRRGRAISSVSARAFTHVSSEVSRWLGLGFHPARWPRNSFPAPPPTHTHERGAREAGFSRGGFFRRGE